MLAQKPATTKLIFITPVIKKKKKKPIQAVSPQISLFLFFYNLSRKKVKVKSLSHVPLFATPCRCLPPWDFPGENTGVGCHFLLQEIFPTLDLNPGLPHCRQMLYHLRNQGSPNLSRIHLLFFTLATTAMVQEASSLTLTFIHSVCVC